MTTSGDADAPPPPGWQPPPVPPPSYAAAPATTPPAAPGPWGPPPPYASALPPPPPPPLTPGMLGAAHKPGAVPLRPLALGDLYDTAFRIIRFNPKATVGTSIIVAAVAMALPLAVTTLLTFTIGMSVDEYGTPDSNSTASMIGTYGSLAVGLVLLNFGTLLVTGMVAHVVSAAAVGRRLGLGEAWAATRGHRWRLVGLALTLGLAYLVFVGLYIVVFALVVTSAPLGGAVVFGIVTIPTFIAMMVWSWIRVAYLAVSAMAIEGTTIRGSLSRAFTLSRNQFWRTFGIALLTVIIAAIATQVLALPIGIVGQVLAVAVGGDYAFLILLATQALTQVISAAFATPFTAAVATLQYVDQRIRKEAYDVDLMRQAGLLG